MKFPQLKLLAVLFLAALLSACGGDPNIETAKLNLENEDYDGVIEAAMKALEENPENADAYYYIGLAHLERSENYPVKERREILKQARESMVKADQLYREQDISSNEAEAAIPLILARWQQSYEEGISLLNFEGENEPEVLEKSLDYLHNALVLAPDSVLNYEALSEVYYMADDIDNAIEYMREAIDRSTEVEPNRYQRITYFYALNDEPDSALEVLLEARERFPEEIYFIQEIANVYFRKGETDKAMEVLAELIEMDPENAEYRLVYGSQIYQQYLNMDQQINDLYDERFELNQSYREEARRSSPDMNRLDEMAARMDEIDETILRLDAERFEIADLAEEELLISYEIDSSNPNTTYTLGAINENRGIALVDQRNIIDDSDKLDELDQRSREYFERALPYYERTAELEEMDDDYDAQDTWLKLFQIYTRLGMNEEAEAAQERAGI